MKNLLLCLSFVVISSTAFAEEIVKMDPGQHPCADIQAVLKRDTQVLLKGLLGYYDIYYLSGSQCPMLHKANISYVSSSDMTFCLAGYTCRLKP